MHFLINSPRVHGWRKETAEEAVAFGQSQLFLAAHETQDHIRRLKNGQETLWTYGWNCVEIIPVADSAPEARNLP